MKLRTADISWRDVEDDVVVLDERTWKYVHLNGSASFLWRALADGATEPELAERLVAQYPDAAASVETDVAAFLADLRARDYLDA